MGTLPKNLDSYGVLYLFGMGDEQQVIQALNRSPELLAIWIEGTCTHPRCHNVTQEVDLKTLAWESLFLKPLYIAWNAEGQSFFAKLQEVQQEIELFASEYQDLGQTVLRNFLYNLPLLSESKLGTALQNKGEGLTAVVCGGGTSLEAMLPLLQKVQHRALIIAGGGAIAALNSKGIMPHLTTGVDPDPSWNRFLEQNTFNTPFLYQSRFSSSQLKALSSPLIFFPGSGTTPFENHVLQELFPWDTGWSVANFSTAVALLLGCKKIIFAGVDFCAKKSKLYATGASQELTDTLSCETSHPDLFTKKDWVASRNWMLNLIEKNPDVEWARGPSLDDKIANAIRQIDDEELLCLDERDLFALVHCWTEALPPVPLSLEQAHNNQLLIEESLLKGRNLCDQLLMIWQQSHPLLPFDLPEFVMTEQALHEELCYQHYLLPLWQVWRFALLRSETTVPGKKLHELLFFKNTLQRIAPC